MDNVPNNPMHSFPFVVNTALQCPVSCNATLSPVDQRYLVFFIFIMDMSSWDLRLNDSSKITVNEAARSLYRKTCGCCGLSDFFSDLCETTLSEHQCSGNRPPHTALGR